MIYRFWSIWHDVPCVKRVSALLGGNRDTLGLCEHWGGCISLWDFQKNFPNPAGLFPHVPCSFQWDYRGKFCRYPGSVWVGKEYVTPRTTENQAREECSPASIIAPGTQYRELVKFPAVFEMHQTWYSGSKMEMDHERWGNLNGGKQILS